MEGHGQLDDAEGRPRWPPVFETANSIPAVIHEPIASIREAQPVHVARLHHRVEDGRALGPGVEAGQAAHVVGGPLDRLARALDDGRDERGRGRAHAIVDSAARRPRVRSRAASAAVETLRRLAMAATKQL